MTEELRSRVAFLRGLAEGLDLGEGTKEEKVLQKVIDILDEITVEVSRLQVDFEELFEYTEAIDEDLTDLEDEFYDDDLDEVDFEEDFENGFTMECPNCREVVVVSDDLLDQEKAIEITCPGCGEVVLVDDEDWEESDLEEDPGEKEE